MQQHTADFGRRLGHEDARAREAPHRYRQRADVILMRMRNQDCFNFPIGDWLKIRQRILSGVLWMHSAIEHQSVAANL